MIIKEDNESESLSNLVEEDNKYGSCFSNLEKDEKLIEYYRKAKFFE